MSKTREKVAQILKELGSVSRTGQNQQQGFTYRSMEEILNAVHPLLGRYGVFITPAQVEYERENRLTSNQKIQTFTVVKVVYSIYSNEDDDVIAMQVVGEAADMGDKSIGKAMTYAYKVLLQQLFAICTNEREDPDAYSPDDTEAVVELKEYQEALVDVASSQDITRLTEVWNEHSKLQKIQPFRDAVARRKKELLDNTKKGKK